MIGIKDMEMPKYCGECKFCKEEEVLDSVGDICELLNSDIIRNGKRVDNCPLVEITVTPFSWDDNLSEIALEDFSLIQKSLPYGTAMSIGTALAKLKMLEKQGCKVNESEEK